MNYAIIDGSTVTKTGTLKTLFPNTSFSRAGVSDSFLSTNNVVELVEWLDITEPDQKLTKVDAYLDSGKAYSVKVETCTDEEKAANITKQWFDIREERNERLDDTDWRASSDLTLSDEWKNYRQALRDITTTQSDPYNITWPTPPS
jgi:acyl carrier protein